MSKYVYKPEDVSPSRMVKVILYLRKAMFSRELQVPVRLGAQLLCAPWIAEKEEFRIDHISLEDRAKMLSVYEMIIQKKDGTA